MICIIGSETTKNYGLFDDLKQNAGYKVVFVDKPSVYEKVIYRLSNRIEIINSLKHAISWERDVLNGIEKIHLLIVLDTALRRLDLRFLCQCKLSNPQIQICCFLLNSVSSITMSDYRIYSKFDQFPWDKIYTFDPLDALNNGWKYYGFNYYSKHQLKSPTLPKYDIFFAGSIVGERGERVFDFFNYFAENNITREFICSGIDKEKRNIPEGINLLHRRIPYKRILSKTVQANCILELLHDGQAGPSLRYFEAICYNKKLLTMNPMITQFPFYDNRYMKVIKDISEIDLEWIKRIEMIDYGYKNEFSPQNMNFC